MLLGLLLSTPGLARAQYDFTTIDIPGSIYTAVDGNSTHALVGEFDDTDENTHGFVLDKKGFTQIDAPDAVGYTSVNGVNARGELAGIYTDSTGQAFGYFWRNGQFTPITVPDSTFTIATFLNVHGEVVGFSRKNLEPRHGYIWRDGVFTAIDVPSAGPRGTRAVSLNDHGQVVGGYADTNNRLRGFLLDKGVYTTFDAPGTENGFTYAQGINNRGQIVGSYSTVTTNLLGPNHGFVLSDGVLKTIDVPDATSTDITSINAKGEIVGLFVDANGNTHGFVGIPNHKDKSELHGDHHEEKKGSHGNGGKHHHQ